MAQKLTGLQVVKKPAHLWNPNVLYHIQKNRPLVLILSHISPFRIPHPTSRSLFKLKHSTLLYICTKMQQNNFLS
jgi:hypothetical protein